ncbi:MAG: DUF748 domain-containing protein [Zoogloeaceae bacterium]|jgi:hypothetical protein|nr:DUF748 domain-containing protein [Zoogloeaceae bacterium]
MSERTSSPPSRRWPKILGISLVLLLLVVVIAFQVAVRVLKGEVIAALGAEAEIRELKIGLTSVEVIGIRLPAPKTEGKAVWPAGDFLRAERLVITPSLASLLSGRIVLKNIRVEGAYLSLLRERDGRLRLLPTLTERTVTTRRPDPARSAALRRSHSQPCAADAGGQKLEIERIEIVESSIDFFDASVRRTPIKITLEDLNFSLDRLRLPELTGESRLKLTGTLKGRAQDGKISVEGKIELASKDSDIQTRLQGVDLTVLQAYLVKASDVGIRSGLLDMEVHSVVKKGHLHGPGALSLRRLELSNNGNAFMGMPRNLVVAVLKGGKDRIDVKFILSGNVDNPGFSLNESIAREIGIGLMGALGINAGSLAKGLGNAGKDIGKLGESLGKMLGGQ